MIFIHSSLLQKTSNAYFVVEFRFMFESVMLFFSSYKEKKKKYIMSNWPPKEETLIFPLNFFKKFK